MEAQAPQNPGDSTARSIGLFAYPKKGQSHDQQASDERACYDNARQSTGFDPKASAGESGIGRRENRPDTLRSGGRGAAGNAGSGAAIGAAVGGVAARRRRRLAQEEAQNGTTAQTQQASDFKRSFSACMESRDYSVK